MSTEQITLKAISPIILHARRSSEQFAPTLDYLPGSTVRGAVADLYLSGNPQRAADEFFQRLFLRGESQFSDFLPVPPGATGPAQLLPGSAVACKRFSDHFEGSLSDSLLRLEWLGERDGETAPNGQPWPSAARMARYEAWQECPLCARQGYQGSRERVEGGYILSLANLKPVQVRRRMMAGAAINRRTGSAASTMLFSHEVLAESDPHDPERSVLFRGVIQVPNELRSQLLALMEIGREIAVGYGRSRGFGLLQVESITTPARPRLALRERWQQMNQAARQLWASTGEAPAGEYFSLTLQSHLLLRDEAGQPVLSNLQPAHLGLPAWVEKRRAILHPAVITGWNTAGNRPKPDRTAIARGSVLLMRVPPGQESAVVIERLEAIEQDGAGEFCQEGFGRISACDPFHFYFLAREEQPAAGG